MNNPTKTKLSKKSEGLSTDTDTVDLPIHLFPPSIPSHKELLEDKEKLNRKRVLDNMYKQSNIFYNFNINIAA